MSVHVLRLCSRFVVREVRHGGRVEEGLRTGVDEVTRKRRDSAGGRLSTLFIVSLCQHRDWLWPAIWMLPENNTYGAWPLSGEIDVRVRFQTSSLLIFRG